MMNLLFSPSGRIAPSQYMRGMIIIAVISALLSLLNLISVSLAVIGGLVGLVLIYCFFALGIKRSHDAGKSGWLSITHFLLLMLVSVAVIYVVGLLFGRSFEDLLGLGAATTGDVAAEARANALPGAIGQFLTYPITAFLVNMLNPHDPTPNQYGTIVDGATFD